MTAEYVDFKTIELESRLDTSIGAELNLRQEGRVSAKCPEEWSGFMFVFLNIKIYDTEEKYFLFDITTETTVKLPDSVREITDEAMDAGLSIAREKTFAAIRSITVGMGINEIDLGGEE